MATAPSLLILIALFAGGAPTSRQTPSMSNVAEVFDKYCSTCHNGSMKSPSGALLEQFDPEHIAAAPDVWARAYRQLQAGTMPPVGAPRPDRATYDAVLLSIEHAMAAPPTTANATSQEIAERLARVLWNTAPDDALRQDAERNRLNEPAVLEREIQRMLADNRAEAFVSRFFFPWLGLDKLRNANPDKQFFPDYDPALLDAFTQETQLFLLSQLREDRDPIDLWSSNYAIVNEQLARHYNIPGVQGSEFRKVTLRSPERSGLLGQGSVLMATSRFQQGSPTFTSPAARSTWVQSHFLGAATPRPFPGAQPVKAGLPITPQTRSLPAAPCMNCHRNFFPLGYALENFDPIGRWRTRDEIGPVDASGAFVDGTPMNGVVELRKTLLERPEAFRTTITEHLLVYASDRAVNPNHTSPDTLVRARQILRNMHKPRWSAIIAGIVREQPAP